MDGEAGVRHMPYRPLQRGALPEEVYPVLRAGGVSERGGTAQCVAWQVQTVYRCVCESKRAKEQAGGARAAHLQGRERPTKDLIRVSPLSPFEPDQMGSHGEAEPLYKSSDKLIAAPSEFISKIW